MKEFKSKWSSKLFWTGCALCAGFFIFKLTAKFTHSLVLSLIAGAVVIGLLIYKTYITDNISIILSVFFYNRFDLYGYFDYFGQPALRGRFQVGKLGLPKKSNCRNGLFSDCTDSLIFS